MCRNGFGIKLRHWGLFITVPRATSAPLGLGRKGKVSLLRAFIPLKKRVLGVFSLLSMAPHSPEGRVF